MNTETTASKSGSFIVSHLAYAHRSETDNSPSSGPAITISEQAGSGAHEIAVQTVEVLQKAEPDGATKWKLYDRQLVEKALEEHHLPARYAKYMPEDRRSYVQDVTEELLGLRPPSWVLVPQIVETIQRLAREGSAILIGRGATVITSGMTGVFHVRLVASLTRRRECVQRLHQLSPEQAVRFIENSDRGSKRYAKAHLHADIEDELLYHLIINTDRISNEDAVALIADGGRRCFKESGSLHGWRQTASSTILPARLPAQSVVKS